MPDRPRPKNLRPLQKNFAENSLRYFASAYPQFPFYTRSPTGTLVHNGLELPDFSLIFASSDHIFKMLN
jgi:hypothetical protein